ncbi:PL29 family lyase N-terminal domain-containing protein [Bacteroides sp.]|uniref:PL29 family lyase N-terminal domain-containing protein n=1 Tax=Bacteroides sp. TaxID=29523 RepID=UPI00258AE69B|nr:PL29 family lyase N-terminal domain-containing protein [Bacteroides sp.]
MKLYILFALSVFGITGCKMENLKDDVNELKDRVTLLEQQAQILNDNIKAMAYILDQNNLAISSVEESQDGSQFTIILSNGDELTLTIGKPGDASLVPTIEIIDGYWYINGVPTGVKAVGEDGTDASIPQFRVEGGKWQVSYGDGNWIDVEGGNLDGIDSLGDQFFQSAAISGDGTSFDIVLQNGEKVSLPVVSLVCEIKKETTDAVSFIYGEVKELDVKINGGEVLAPLYPAGWRAELIQKVATSDEYNYILVIYSPSAPLSRVSADNTSEISVRVTDGVEWAVDKIKVTATEKTVEP